MDFIAHAFTTPYCQATALNELTVTLTLVGLGALGYGAWCLS